MPEIRYWEGGEWGGEKELGVGYKRAKEGSLWWWKHSVSWLQWCQYPGWDDKLLQNMVSTGGKELKVYNFFIISYNCM